MRTDMLREEWSARIKACADCIVKEDYTQARALMAEAINDVEAMALSHEYFTNPITNFGKLNHMVSENIVTLQECYPDFIKDWKALLKEDKNLRAQHMLYAGLTRFSKDFASDSNINEAIALCAREVDKETLIESNIKAFDLLKKYDLIIDDMIEEEAEKYYGACQFMLLNEKNNLNLVKHAEALTEIKGYISNQAKDTISESIGKANDKMKNLTEDEQRIVNAMTGTEDEKKEAFEGLKSECLKKVCSVSNGEDVDSESKERISKIREAIENMEFNMETFNENVNKMLDLLEI